MGHDPQQPLHQLIQAAAAYCGHTQNLHRYQRHLWLFPTDLCNSQLDRYGGCHNRRLPQLTRQSFVTKHKSDSPKIHNPWWGFCRAELLVQE